MSITRARRRHQRPSTWSEAPMRGLYRSCNGPSSAIVVSVMAAVAASDAHIIIIDSGMSQQGCGTLWGALTECRGGDNRQTRPPVWQNRQTVGPPKR